MKKLFLFIFIFTLLISFAHAGSYESHFFDKLIYQDSADWHYVEMENKQVGFNKNNANIGFGENKELIGELTPVAIGQHPLNDKYYLCPLINPEVTSKIKLLNQYQITLSYTGYKNANCYEYDNYGNSFTTNISINSMELNCYSNGKCKLSSDITFNDITPKNTGFGYIFNPVNESAFRYINYKNKTIDLKNIEKITTGIDKLHLINNINNNTFFLFDWQDMLTPETAENYSNVKVHFEVLDIADKRGLLIGSYGYGNNSNVVVDPIFQVTDITINAKLDHTVVEGGSYIHTNLTYENLSLYMPFDVDTGTTTFDWSQYNYDGTEINTPTWTVDGYSGGGYLLDRANREYINIVDPVNVFGGKTVAWSLWVKFKSLVGSQDVISSNNFQVFAMRVGSTGSVNCYVRNDSANFDSVANDAGSAISAGEWNHFICVYNGSNIIMFQNGVKQSDLGVLQGTIPDHLTIDIQIGDQGIAGRSVNGTIDEVMFFTNVSMTDDEWISIYNRTLQDIFTTSTPKRVTTPPQLTNSTDEDGLNVSITLSNQNKTNVTLKVIDVNESFEGQGENLVGCYLFEHGNAVDCSSHGNDGIITEAVWNETGSYNGSGAFDFDGVSPNVGSRIKIGTDPDFSDVCIDGCSFSAWGKLTDFTNQRHALVGRWDTGLDDRFFWLVVEQDAHTRFTIVEDGTGGTLCDVEYTGGDVELNIWYNYVGVYDNSTGTGNVSIYRNGVILDSTTCGFSGINVTAWGDDEDTFIGQNDEGGHINTWNGSIDEVMIWNYPLSASNISTMYQNSIRNHTAPQKSEAQTYTNEDTRNNYTVQKGSFARWFEIDFIPDEYNFATPIVQSPINSTSYNITAEAPAPDTTFPTYSNNQTNSTINGSDINHSLLLADDIALDWYKFSFCNGTWDGSDCSNWLNDSWIDISGTSYNITTTKRSNTTNNSQHAWCYYFNDTAGNTNETSCENPFIYNVTEIKEGAVSDPCDCPATDTNWQWDLTQNCRILSDCNMNKGNLSFINTGAIYCNATITASINSNLTLMADQYLNMTGTTNYCYLNISVT